MRTRSIAAVAAGGLLDIVATNLFAFPVLVYVAATRGLAGVPAAEVGPRMVAELHASPSLQLVSWAAGLAATMLGGYVAARLAGRAEVRHGALSAWACMALGVYALATGADAAPAWQHALAFVLAPAGGALGGELRRRQADRGDDADVAPTPA